MNPYPHRSYGQTTHKDMGDSLLLLPWEKPRVKDPYVDPGEPCPKCGCGTVKGGLDNATRYMEVEHGCGYRGRKFVGSALPITEEMKAEDFGNRKETTCIKCGTVFSQLAKKNHEDCPRCRYNEYQKMYARKYGKNKVKGSAERNVGNQCHIR